MLFLTDRPREACSSSNDGDNPRTARVLEVFSEGTSHLGRGRAVLATFSRNYEAVPVNNDDNSRRGSIEGAHVYAIMRAIKRRLKRPGVLEPPGTRLNIAGLSLPALKRG